MMVKLFDGFLRWYNEVKSCFYHENNRCISATVGFSSAFCLVLSYLVLLGGRCKLKGALTAAVCVLYSLIGNLCNVAGAFLSNQSLLQLIMALLMVTLDVVHFIAVTLLVCWWRHSKTGRKARMLNRRRRQNSLAVCLLFGMGGCVYLEECMQHTQRYDSPTSRKLLNVIVHDHIGLLGYVLGLLSFVISLTSRFPFFLESNRRKMSNPTHVSSRGFSALAGALYTSAIVLYDPQMQSVVKALPWILSGACCALLDIAILLLSCYKICSKQRSVRLLGLDNKSLLGRFNRVSADQHQSSKEKGIRKHRLPSHGSSSPNLTQMGHYLDVSVQPVRKVCLKEVTITREGSSESQPQKRCVKVVRVDECYSSGSTTDSLCLSSELEWDFEEATPQWSSQKGEQQNGEEFALQDWMVDQRSKSNTRSSSRACFCNNADLVETASGTPDTNSKLSDSVK